MDGAELADSVVVNPHKWLFVPLDFSALFTRRPEALRAVFALTPEYLCGDASRGADDEAPGDVSGAAVRNDIDYMDYGIQLGRRFHALKAWTAFRGFGRDGVESRVREHCRLAARPASWVEAEPDVVLAEPQRMGIVCFRVIPPALDDAECDALNEKIVEDVNASGDAYLTPTRLGGRVCIRAGSRQRADDRTPPRARLDACADVGRRCRVAVVSPTKRAKPRAGDVPPRRRFAAVRSVSAAAVPRPPPA